MPQRLRAEGRPHKQGKRTRGIPLTHANLVLMANSSVLSVTHLQKTQPVRRRHVTLITPAQLPQGRCRVREFYPGGSAALRDPERGQSPGQAARGAVRCPTLPARRRTFAPDRCRATAAAGAAPVFRSYRLDSARPSGTGCRTAPASQCAANFRQPLANTASGALEVAASRPGVDLDHTRRFVLGPASGRMPR